MIAALVLAVALAEEPHQSSAPQAEPAAGRWKDLPIEPKAQIDGTAYTLDQRHWRIGLINQEYGLLDNFQFGVKAPLFALGVLNIHGKVSAIQTNKLDFSLDGEVLSSSLAKLGLPDATVLITPVGWTGSWAISRRFGASFGTSWLLASVEGTVDADTIAGGIEQVTGADVSRDLRRALGDGGGVYAGARMSLFQTRFMVEYRMNRRDSLVLRSNTFVYLTGLVAAGVAVDTAKADVQAGASASISLPLRDSVPTLTTLSWQFAWRKFNLRLGVPLPLNNSYAWMQAVEAYFILGPDRKNPNKTEP